MLTRPAGLLLLYFIPLSVCFAAERLVFALDLIRHGSRTPLSALPKSTSVWPEGLGQLTAQGIAQEYRLGRSLRQRYLHAHLLPAHYKTDSIKVYSTNWDRTRMSAQAFLQGLYHAAPIPIHTFVEGEASALVRKQVFTRPVWQKKQTQFSSLLPRWSKATGVTLKHISQVIPVGDALFITQRHQQPIPQELTDTDARAIIHLGHWAWVNLYHDSAVARAVGAGTLKKIAHWLQQSVQPHNQLKYVLLSAHDSSIAAQMTLLGIAWDTVPPYAADLNFSVYAQENNPPIVKLTLNNQALELKQCASNPCQLKHFMQLTERVLK